MACYAPMAGWKSRDGKGFTTQASNGYLDQPVKVACGRCIGCRLERSRQWSVRLMHEASQHLHNSFLTLTYSDEHLPADKSISTRTWQLFAKRLRESHGAFRFYHCGEYGEATNRPHYHAIIFGLDFYEDRKQHKTTPRGDVYYVSPSLEKTWGLGHVIIGEVTPQSASYVARYTLGKHYGPLSTHTYGERVDQVTGELDYYLQPPYATMSRRPGIGKGWIDKYKDEVFPSDEVIVDGRQARTPSYYDFQLPDEELAEVKKQRRIKSLPHRSNNTPDRLAVRETVKLSQISKLQRDLS